MARRILTERQQERFKELYPGTPNNIMMKQFDMDLTGIYQTANLLKVKKSHEYFPAINHSNNGRAWTDEEIEILESNYIYYSDSELKRLLPNRSTGSISTKRQALGFIKGEPRPKAQKRQKKSEESKAQKIPKYKLIKHNQIVLHNTQQIVNNVLKLYGVTEKIADKIR